jgi:selenocysteine lyase/cysteine desulfurase
MSIEISRRELLAGMAGLAASAAVRKLSAQSRMDAATEVMISGEPKPGAPFPAKGDFAIPDGVTYLNGAYTHPMPIAGARAAREYATSRAQLSPVSQEFSRLDIKAQFARLINAKPSEISYVPNTSTGENLVVNGLGIPDMAPSEGNVVTDALHFDGAILHLGELERRRGLDLRIVMPREWRIDMKDMERVVDKRTRLVEVSLVAMHNGFQHDLKEVCDLAHAHGAYVYADIIQAAGNTPIDVRASGVDFCACSSFKWLMGDFGLGFLYVKEELLDRVIGRAQYGYFQGQHTESHFLPGDSPPPLADTPYTWDLGTNASAYFEVGTSAYGAGHVLAESLPYILGLGVENIRAWRQPLLSRLRQEMPRHG